MQRGTDWQWDSAARLWYYYDPHRQCEVYENGLRREPRQRVEPQQQRVEPQQPRNVPDATRERVSAAHHNPNPNTQSGSYGLRSTATGQTAQYLTPPAQHPAHQKRPVPRDGPMPQTPDVRAQDFARLNLNPNVQPPVRIEQKEWTTSNGDRILNVKNPLTEVQTTIKLGPVARITDPTLLKKGIKASQMLLPTEGDTETLYADYKRRAQPRRFFTFGKVFRVLWSEPAGDDRTAITFKEGVSTGRFRERVFSKVRLFVVIREGDNFCSALSIVTYGGQALTKFGVTKSDFSVIYTGKSAPLPLDDEAPRRGEEPMRPDPIRVNPDDKGDPLNDLSRINYAKVYTIEHNLKVKPYGQVHPGSEAALRHQFYNVWLGEAATSALRQSQNQSLNQQTSAPTKRGNESSGRRPSHSTSTAESGSGRVQMGRAAYIDDREAQAKAAVIRLMHLGHTREHALQTVRETARQHERQLEKGRGSDDGRSDAVDSDSDSNRDDDDSQRRSSDGRSRKERTMSGSMGTGSRRQYPPRHDSRPREPQLPPRDSSLPSSAPPGVQLQSQGHHGSVRPTPTLQAPVPGQSTAQPQPPAGQQADVQQLSQANVQTQAMLQHLAQRGYGREQALQYIATAVGQLVERNFTREQALQHLAASMARQRAEQR